MNEDPERDSSNPLPSAYFEKVETPDGINVVAKLSYSLPVSEEFLGDLVTGKPETRRARQARERKHAELQAAGLLNEEGDQINPTECPACYTVADGTAAGWNGPLGDYVRCERPRGHEGDHMFTVLWDESDG